MTGPLISDHMERRVRIRSCSHLMKYDQSRYNPDKDTHRYETQRDVQATSRVTELHCDVILWYVCTGIKFSHQSRLIGRIPVHPLPIQHSLKSVSFLFCMSGNVWCEFYGANDGQSTQETQETSHTFPLAFIQPMRQQVGDIKINKLCQQTQNLLRIQKVGLLHIMCPSVDGS